MRARSAVDPLARQPGLEVTGLDLDLAMIERARANADRRGNTGGGQASFLVGDVASLAFPDRSFDLVVSTLSMHHWADPAAGLTEIGRVLRPGGRALIWDLRPGALPFHAHAPDPVEHTHDAPLGWSARRLGPGPGGSTDPADRAGPGRRRTRGLRDIERLPVDPAVRQARHVSLLGVHPSRRNSGRYASRKGRLEEGDQFLGDGFGFEQWGKVTDARQLSDVRVDDVLGHVAFHVGEEGAE